jgi:hypothetical protein
MVLRLPQAEITSRAQRRTEDDEERTTRRGRRGEDNEERTTRRGLQRNTAPTRVMGKTRGTGVIYPL